MPCYYKTFHKSCRLSPVSTPETQQTTVEERWAHRLGHLLWETYFRMSLLADAEFADSSLSSPAIGVLDMTSEWPGSTIAELARRGPKTPQAVSQVVSRLERLGFIERRLGHGRGVGLYITPAGVQARAEGHRHELAVEQKLLAQLGPDLYEELKTALDRARSALSQANP
jgi:DNA-binding MarR family transcriptional regulator